MEEDILVALKRTYKDVYSVVAGKNRQEYIFRALTFQEFDEISHAFNSEWDSAEAEEAIIALGLLYPEDVDLDRMPAGIVTSLASEILTVSGFLPGDEYTKNVVEECRAQTTEFRNMMYAVIIMAMPAYKTEDLDNFTFAELAKKLALSENIIQMQRQLNGIPDAEFKLVFAGEQEQQQQPYKPLSKEEVLQGKAPVTDPIAQKLHQAFQG